MECVYRTRTATLYLGDCLDVVPRIRRTIDTVVTSPPYNIALGSNGSTFSPSWTARTRKLGYDDSFNECEYQSWLNHVATVLASRCKGLVWINHKVRYRNGTALHPARLIRLPLYCEVIWDRRGGINFNSRRFALSHEGLYAFGRPHYWDASHDKNMSVWALRPTSSRTDHPCPFPIELAERPILASCPPGGVVLDPFAGSCTVGVAALAHGRKFIGIEKNPAYVDDAIERLKGWRTETRKAA